jgi:DNA helicase-2/ATP-dependent DNA helicase PcrA
MPELTEIPHDARASANDAAPFVGEDAWEGMDALAAAPTPPTLDELLARLDPEQRQAAAALRGPVAILAGAGTGKTTTITHRIACQVASGAFEAKSILAVTFTDKAAGVLRSRLAALGAKGVEARTFHSAALWQLHVLSEQYTGVGVPRILPSKAMLLAPLVKRLPAPMKFLPTRDVATEIEWAKARRITPDTYLEAVRDSGHEPPMREDLMQKVYRDYQRSAEREGVIDFEDVLARTVDLFDRFPESIERIRSRFASFTVDEYQDVNPLQAALLDRWVGDRDDLCVVGDDYQTIYSFTGASSSHLLGFTSRFPQAEVVRLERSYRSTPQVLAVANRLATHMQGIDKQLVAAREGDGPAVRVVRSADAASEVDAVVARVRELAAAGVPLVEQAVLLRTNADSEPFEGGFAAAGVPYQVRHAAFLQRPAARTVLRELARAGRVADGVPPADGMKRVVTSIALDLGLGADAGDGKGRAAQEEATRQSDLARLVQLAGEFEHSSGGTESIEAFVAALTARFSADGDVQGVQLLTLHRAKGLEFDAVHMPRLIEGTLPYRSRGSVADIEEERRLFYVGATRARHHLLLSFAPAGKKGMSQFLTEAGAGAELPIEGKAVATSGKARSSSRFDPDSLEGATAELFERLRQWRSGMAKELNAPAYVVFDNATLAAIAEAAPADLDALGAVSGVGPAKLEKFGAEVVTLVNA